MNSTFCTFTRWAILGLIAGPAAAVGLQPFECADESIVAQNVDTDLLEGDQLFTEKCSDLGIEVDSIGFRSTDGFLYAVELTDLVPGDPASFRGNRGLIRIGNDCSWESLGSPSGLPAEGADAADPAARFDAGTVSSDGRVMYVNHSGESPLYTVDLTPLDSDPSAPLTATEVGLTTVPSIDGGQEGGLVDDWAYHPGFEADEAMLFGGDQTHGEVAILDVASGFRIDVTVAVAADVDDQRFSPPQLFGLPQGIAYGGARFDSEGRLVLYRNGTDNDPDQGEIYVIDVSAPFAPEIVAVRSAPGTSRNDATTCSRQTACDRAFFVQDDDFPRLFATDPSAPPFEWQQICGPASDNLDDPVAGTRPWSLALESGTEYNNMCFRRTDQRLYALELSKYPNGNDGLVRFDPDTCEVENLTVTGLPAGERFDSGDCSADGEAMFVSVGGVRTKFYRLDLETGVAERMTICRKLGSTPGVAGCPSNPGSSNFVGYVHDWAYNPADGKLYGGDNTDGHLASLEIVQNPDGQWIGLRHDRNVIDPADAGFQLPSGSGQMSAYGSAWFNAAGHLVLHRNDGQVYEIDVASRQLVSSTTLRGSGYNDGASCFEATP